MNPDRFTLIRSGLVISEEDAVRQDVLIKGERIDRLSPAIEEQADSVVDAGGLLVLPGTVDPHVHFNDEFMGTVSVHDYFTGTLAAAYGVAVTTTMTITTILFFVVAREHWGWSAWRAGLLTIALNRSDVIITTGGLGPTVDDITREAVAQVTGRELGDVNFTTVRGLAGVKEATIDLDGRTLNVAAASGLGNARVILENIERGTSKYDVIEIMACPGGCVGGGGQPLPACDEKRALRAEALYRDDREVQQYRQRFTQPRLASRLTP